MKTTYCKHRDSYDVQIGSADAGGHSKAHQCTVSNSIACTVSILVANRGIAVLGITGAAHWAGSHHTTSTAVHMHAVMAPAMLYVLYLCYITKGAELCCIQSLMLSSLRRSCYSTAMTDTAKDTYYRYSTVQESSSLLSMVHACTHSRTDSE